MNKTRIDWCDCTINPVVGCSRMCGAEFDKNGKMTKRPWCYAYNMNCRFKWVKDFSKPQFFPERLKALESKKPKSIFMNSMSDVAFWQDDWVFETFKALDANPHHNYIFLTKSGSQGIYGLHYGEQKLWAEIRAHSNVFIGLTVATQDKFPCGTRYDFLSIEPILEPITIPNNYSLGCIKQIIIGAETGNRKGKVIPKKEWIDDIVKQADEHGIRVFMKESLRFLMKDEFRQDKLLWEIEK